MIVIASGDSLHGKVLGKRRGVVKGCLHEGVGKRRDRGTPWDGSEKQSSLMISVF
jgi:hypothetical protein